LTLTYDVLQDEIAGVDVVTGNIYRKLLRDGRGGGWRQQLVERVDVAINLSDYKDEFQATAERKELIDAKLEGKTVAPSEAREGRPG